MSDHEKHAHEPVDAPVERPVDENGVPLTTAKPEHGAQVHLTGEARAAARGALHDNMMDNLAAKQRAEQEGRAAPGTTPDGSTVDGRLPADTLHGADQAQYGEAGKGEGIKGHRPGDAELIEAEQKAAAERERAKGEG